MQSCRDVFDNMELEKGENSSLLMARYVKNLDDKGTSKTDLFKAMKKAANKAYDLYSIAFKNRQEILKKIAESKRFKTVESVISGLGNGSVLETGLALNPIYGLPMLPASSIKGITAHYCSKVLGESDPDYKAPVFEGDQVVQEAGKIYAALFGKIYPQEEQEAGFLRFYDAWIVPQRNMDNVFVDDVMTPHNTNYYATKDKKYIDFEDPVPVRFLSVEGEFDFWITCQEPDYENRKLWIDFAFKILKEALENFGIGGKLRSGYGKMKKILSDEERKEQERQKKIQENRKLGYLHDDGEVLQIVCKKVKIFKGKEKRDFAFVSDDKDKTAIRFEQPPKIQEGEIVNAELLRIEKENKAYVFRTV